MKHEKSTNVCIIHFFCVAIIVFVFFLYQNASGQTVPTKPTLSFEIIGTSVNLYYSANNAEKYILYVAPYPDASTVYDFDMGNQISSTFDLPTDTTFYVAFKALNSAGMSELSNIEHLNVSQNMNFAGTCGAFVAPGVWKDFDCYNLAAIGKTTKDDPFIPSWRLIGGYWQWGRKGPDSSQWYNTNSEHFAHGPTGTGSSDANAGHISGWSQTYAPNSSWTDLDKTTDDPCPDRFRVPSESQWKGVLSNNQQTTVGTWSGDSTNYNSARFFGNSLMLPAAGFRHNKHGSLYYRNSNGYYWSSSEISDTDAFQMYFNSSAANIYKSNRISGFSVRCVIDNSSSSPSSPSTSPEPLSVDKTNVLLASGYNEKISIIGGSGYYTVDSTDNQVVSAVIDGSSLEINGLSEGTATLMVKDTAGSMIGILVTVVADEGVSGNCGAFLAPGVWKEFDCYNLAAIGKTSNDDPFTPSWRLIGGFWQWGRKGPDSNLWYNTNTEHFAHGPTGPDSFDPGPTGPGFGENINPGGIWDTVHAANSAWSDMVKTENDPCPPGFRLPTKSQWDNLLNNNIQSTIGTWQETPTNYSSALFLGPKLMLPAAGFVYSYEITSSHGQLKSRGYHGNYWSSTQNSDNLAWYLYFYDSAANTKSSTIFRTHGLSVRCIAE